MSKDCYDIVFIGLGASTSLVLMELERQNVLDNYRILVVEPEQKVHNDKTFCFWASSAESIVQELKDMIHHQWTKVGIQGQTVSLNPLSYYRISSLDLYDHIRKLIDGRQNIDVHRDTVHDVEDVNDELIVSALKSNYRTQWVCDSRPIKTVSVNPNTVLQSFMGWEVEFSEPVLDSNTFHMMDFDIPQDDFTQFIYMLPESSTQGLIEMTRFGCDPLSSSRASDLLEEFCSRFGCSFEIHHIEKGVIPMSQHNRMDVTHPRWIHLGSRAGNVKPTTGYTFYNMYCHAQSIVSYVVDGKGTPLVVRPQPKGRFFWYDAILLQILSKTPIHGKEIFTQLFDRNSIQHILGFLNEQSRFQDELRMFVTLPKGVFIRAALQVLLRDPHRYVALPLMCTAVLLSSSLIGMGNQWLEWMIVFGMFVVGIPHGSIDGFTRFGRKNTVLFFGSYIVSMCAMGLLWFLSPTLSLSLFLLYSAWHFGQTDFEEHHLASSAGAFVWGTGILTTLICGHWSESLTIIELLIGQTPVWGGHAEIITWSALTMLGISVCHQRSLGLLSIFVVVALGVHVSLLSAFGVYFVFHHSMTAWQHLQYAEDWTHKQMWIRGLPFSIGAAVLLGAIGVFQTDWLGWLPLFFMFISIISLPHTVFMSRFYRQ